MMQRFLVTKTPVNSEPLDSTTLLIKAIYNNNYAAALHAIQHNAEVNTLTEHLLPDSKTPPEDSTLFTPLQIAVFSLKFKLVQLLLCNGADPNILNSDGGSTMEIFLIALAIRICDAAHGKQVKYLPPLFKLFNIKKELSRAAAISANEYTLAEHILDLLLCYGLNPDPEWTDAFKHAYQILECSSASFENNYQVMKNLSVTVPEAAATTLKIEYEQKKAFFLKKNIIASVIKFAAKRYVAREYGIGKTNKHTAVRDFILTCKTVKMHAVDAEKEINKEKITYLKELRDTADSGLNYKLTPVLLDLILQYIMDVSKEVAEKRALQKRTINFWQYADPLKFELENNEEFLRQATQYIVRLLNFFEEFSVNSEFKMKVDTVKIISEYAVTLKKH